MRCKKCGTELGQKNLCPVCSPAKKQPQTGEASRKPAGRTDIPASLDAELEKFVKANPFSWNSKFNDFYNSLEKGRKSDIVGYRDAVEKCRRWDSILSAIRGMLDKNKELTADLVLAVMDAIPPKFPEIDDDKARSLAGELFQMKPPADQYSILVIPEDGMLYRYPAKRRQYKSAEPIFYYHRGENELSRAQIPAPFDCTVKWFDSEEKKSLSAGEPIAILCRIPRKK